jgi:hypothetical protein
VNDNEDIDARLARLRHATRKVRPRRDFTQRVLAVTVSVNEPPIAVFLQDLPRIARRLVPLAALVAALGIAWGFTNDDAVDEALAGSYSATELEW